MTDILNKTVLVTGGRSMIGRYVCKDLVQMGAIVHNAPHEEVDWLSLADSRYYFDQCKPEYVIHLAGWNGGIEWNRTYPADIFYKNTQMGLNVLNCCVEYSVEKIISVLASCAYPGSTDEELKEEDLWNGLPHDSVECHGLAKRTLHAYSKQIQKQYGIPAICCILTNCYGPHDSYHPQKTKVVGALIRKFVEAKQQNLPKVFCWGTGEPLREFMYAEDAGKAINNVLLYYNELDPINIGSGQEISIRELAETIAYIVGYKGKIIWESSGGGQKRKRLNLDRYYSTIKYPITPLKTGLLRTIMWYVDNKEQADVKSV